MTKENLKKILVVEDQSGTLEEISLAIRESYLGETLEGRFSDYPEQELIERDVDVARDYENAQKFIESNNYDLVFLDHRLPQKYDSLIGTSSCDDSELRGFEKPDYIFNKNGRDTTKALSEILEDIKTKIKVSKLTKLFDEGVI